MSPKLKQFLKVWLVNTLAVLIAARVLNGHIQYATSLDLFLATLVLGILNAFLRPMLMLLSLPLLVLTLGLFTLVINALLLLAVSWLMRPGFTVDTFGTAFWGALIISIVSMVFNSILGNGQSRMVIQKNTPKPPRDSGDGNGPVIDV